MTDLNEKIIIQQVQKDFLISLDAFAKELNIKEGDSFILEVKNNGLLLKPKKNK